MTGARVAILVCVCLLTAGTAVPDAVEHADASDRSRAASEAGGSSFCLVSVDDVTLENTSIEVFHQTADPMITPDQTITSGPVSDEGEPLQFTTDRLHAEELCASFGDDRGPIRVTMEGVSMTNVTIEGPALTLNFDGEADTLSLWISIESALELLPDLLGEIFSTDSTGTTNGSTSSHLA